MAISASITAWPCIFCVFLDLIAENRADISNLHVHLPAVYSWTDVTTGQLTAGLTWLLAS